MSGYDTDTILDLFETDQDLMDAIDRLVYEPSISSSSKDFEFDFNDLFSEESNPSNKDSGNQNKATQTPGSWESFPKYRRGKYKAKTTQKYQYERKRARHQDPPNLDLVETVLLTSSETMKIYQV